MPGMWYCGNCKRPYDEAAYQRLQGDCPVCKVGKKTEFVWRKDAPDTRPRCVLCGVLELSLDTNREKPCASLERLKTCWYAWNRKREQWLHDRDVAKFENTGIVVRVVHDGFREEFLDIPLEEAGDVLRSQIT